MVSLREIAGDHGTALMRAEAHLSATAGGWSDLSFAPGRVVPTGPARLRFRYVAEPGPDGRAPAPVDSWPSGPTLPAAVIVEAVEPVSTHLLVSARIGVRADGDIGCADRTSRQSNDAAPGSHPAAGAGGIGASRRRPAASAGAGAAQRRPLLRRGHRRGRQRQRVLRPRRQRHRARDPGTDPGGNGSSLPRSVRL